MRSPSLAHRLEWLVATASLLLLSDALDASLHAVSAADASLPLARVILIPFFAAAFVLLARHPGQTVRNTVAAWPAMLPVAVAVASYFWSIAPPFTLRWLAGLAGTTVVGLFLAARFDADEQLDVVCAALGIVALASVAALVFSPQTSTRMTQHGFAWRGIFEENNLFGRAMGLAALAFFVLALERRGLRLVAVGGFVLSAVLLLGSRSLSARLVTGACSAGTGAVFLYRRQSGAVRRRAAVAAAVTTLVVAAVLAQNSGRVAVLLGRDASFTGRTILWAEVLELAREHPWLGRGYATFWPYAQQVPERLTFPPDATPVRHSHNGFLDILFELGVLGLVSFAAPFLILLWRAASRGASGRAGLWPLAYLLFLGLSNGAESGLLRHKIFWALYVAVAVSLCKKPNHPSEAARIAR